MPAGQQSPTANLHFALADVMGQVLTTGRTFFVSSTTTDSSDTDGRSGRDPNNPLATLDAAFGASYAGASNGRQGAANNGDIIFVMPNHAETVTGVGGITADIAGVTVIGLGSGSQRPRFLMDGATSVSVLVDANDITFRNLVFASGHSDVVTCFDVNAATGCWIDAVEFENNIADENWLTPISCTGAADNSNDGLRVTNCRWLTIDIGSLEFINLEEVTDGAVIEDNLVIHEGTASPLILGETGASLTRCSVQRNFLSHKMTANELLVNIGTAGSGIIAHNRVRHADVTTTHDLGIDSIGMGLFDNLSTSVDNLSGVVLPAADVNS